MLNRTFSQNKLLLFAVGLVIGVLVSAGVITFFDGQNIFLVFSVLAFVAVLTILHLNSWMEWIALVMGMLAYGYIQYTLQQPMRQMIFQTGIFCAGLLLTFILSRLFHHQVAYFVGQYRSNSNLINELTLHDAMGMLKWKPFQRKLDEEFIRSRRTKKPVSIMMLRIFNYKDLVSEGHSDQAERLTGEIAKVCMKILRTLDVVSRYDQETLAMILPDTSADEANIAAERVLQGITQQLNTPIYLGIASFPSDAVSVEKILARAQAALDFAVNSEKDTVSFSQMSAGKKEAKKA